MTDADNEWLDDPDDDDAPCGASSAGYLFVPGVAESQAAFAASAVGFRADWPVIFTGLDEATNETWLDNRAELQAAGFTGSTIDQAEQFLLAYAGPPRQQPKGTTHGPPRSPQS